MQCEHAITLNFIFVVALNLMNLEERGKAEIKNRHFILIFSRFLKSSYSFQWLCMDLVDQARCWFFRLLSIPPTQFQNYPNQVHLCDKAKGNIKLEICDKICKSNSDNKSDKWREHQHRHHLHLSVPSLNEKRIKGRKCFLYSFKKGVKSICCVIVYVLFMLNILKSHCIAFIGM